MLGVVPSIASAANTPWWHLTSGARPTYLNSSAHKPAIPGVDEVQDVTVQGSSGESFVLANLTSTEVKEFIAGTKEPPASTYGSFKVGEESAAMQVKLEAIYGSGNVEVKGGLGAQAGLEPYEVKFVGALADKPVQPINSELSEVIEGFKGIVTVTQAAAGKPEVLAVPDGEIYFTAENVGDANVDGSKTPVQYKAVLPPGLRATGIVASKPFKEGNFNERARIPCSLETLTCTLKEGLAPFDDLELRVSVEVEPGAVPREEVVESTISGGGSEPASLPRTVTVSTEPVPFGVNSYEMALEEAGGASVTQAGAHPFQLSTSIQLNQLADISPLTESGFKPEVGAPALAKDLNFKLPPGLIGNPTSIPECTTAQFFETVDGKENRCPPDTAVGVAIAIVHEPTLVGTVALTEPIFNLEPRAGEPARFGFFVVPANSPVFIDTSLRTGGDYGVTVDASNITQTAAFLSSNVTFWGVPGDPRHDKQRGWGCLYEARQATVNQPCVPAENAHPKPFLSMPTACTALQTTVEGDTWATPGSFFTPFTGEFKPEEALTGCNRLSFKPEFNVQPEKTQASTPTGVTADLHFPNEENATGNAPSALKSTTVVLPEGLQLNAASAGGLEACTQAQAAIHNAEEASCPNGSKLANVTVSSPLIPNPLKGGMFLASPQNFATGPQENPFGTLLAAYLIVKDPISGVLVKLAGRGELNETTGRITLSFASPQVPFEDAKFEFLGGERAPEVTPAHCGTYTTQAIFTPYSGTEPVTASTSFNITSGPGGSPCPPASLPFAPTLAAGTTNNNAASFSPLTTTISREDGEQFMNSVTLHMPPGLAGVIAGIPRCPEAQANAGTCPAASLIGHTTASVGIGKDPFTVTGGQVFLTEGYKGAPFGLSIVTPAVAGPFNLGNVVVRAKIEVNPTTAALTVTTDELPHILKGIPLEIKKVNVSIDRQGFTFNTTSCNPLTITGTVGAVEGASANVSSSYQATNCAALKFAPKFSVSTSGKASKAGGASLDVKVAAKGGPQPAGGGEANIRSVKVSLPKQLPSRLTTLQKACLAAVFEANPASCPKESDVGTATAKTPILTNPLIGPAYLVSHGGAAFPDLEIVLQGEGIKLLLDGHTDIKKGITTSTFNTVPDAPISSFELKLPTGPFSVLAAYVAGSNHYSFCGQSLTLPTTITAQNGAVITQTTKLGVTGCPKAKTRAQKLKAAMKVCHKKAKGKRAACVRQARKKYGPLRKK